MTVPPSRDPARPAMTRAAVVEAALALVDEEGLDALAMRPLADRLGVKPASLYWHVRDRRELTDLLADALLEGADQPRGRGGWRASAAAACEAMKTAVARRDGTQVVLQSPGALERSAVHRHLSLTLARAGLDTGAAAEAATMLLTFVVARGGPVADEELSAAGPEPELRRLAIDSGSKGVTIRAGEGMSGGLVREAQGSAGPAPAVIHGDTLVVRRFRGRRDAGELELDPAHPWTFRIHGGTLNTRLDLSGIDVRGIHLDSGAAKIEIILPHPRGVVPIAISGGAYNVTIRRPASAAMTAIVSSGGMKLQLDNERFKFLTHDFEWESPGGAARADRYQVAVSGGSWNVTIDATAPEGARVVRREQSPAAYGAIELLLDGIAAKLVAHT